MSEILTKLSWQRACYTFNFFISFVIHYCMILFKVKMNSKWVFGSGNGLLENNIEVFFNYVLDKNENQLCFISNNKKFLKENEFAIKRGSVKAYLYCLAAEVIIIDTDNSDVCPGFLNICQGYIVNVSHGQEGLKKLPKDYYQKINADLHCAVSELEAEIKIEKCGAHPGTVFITGYPRYDILKKQTFENNNILLFFTWRPWFDKNESELRSYIEKINVLLNSSALYEYLDSINATIFFKPHHMLKGKVNLNVNNKRIVILEELDNLSNVIRETSVLITDYSSVCWDYIYTNRQVVFYQFDFEIYNESVGLYLSKKDPLFNSSCYDVPSLITTLKAGNTNNSELNQRFFKYEDSKNCERIYNKIMMDVS